MNWIKNNKLTVFLTLVIIFLLFKQFLFGPILPSLLSSRVGMDTAEFSGAPSIGFAPGVTKEMSYRSDFYSPSTPQMNVSDRKVVTDSHLSLLVRDVRDSVERIRREVESKRGYLVTTSINSPEGATTGYVTIRVPSEQLQEVLTFLRALSVRVVSENISGNDVTDQYVDIQSRLDTLSKTKGIYESMLDRAVNVDEILRVQQAIFNVQDQIDNYQGQLKYLEATSASTLITVNLSTDELSLPYAPDNPWRPNVVFKHAVRSVLGAMRGLANATIWVAVYGIIWVPIVLAVYLFKRYRRKS